MKTKTIVLSIAIVALITTVAETTASAQPEGPDFVYLTCTSDPTNTMTVSWRTSENYAGEVRYDTQPRVESPGSYDNTEEGSGAVTTEKLEGYYHHVKLTGLEPDTKYYFSCGDNARGWSEELSFRTAPLKKENIRFVVGGDSRWDPRPDHPHPDWPECRDNATQLMANYNPDFAVFIGDYLWSGEYQEGDLFGYELENFPDTWNNWLKAWYKYARAKDGRMIPIVPVIGNHEIVYPEPSVYEPMTQASNYYTLFNLPVEENWYGWYSLNWGPDLHITVLDSEIRYPGSDIWSDQVSWLRQDLTDSYDDLWKIATAHRPIFSAGGVNHNLKKDWVPEFNTYHVDFYFNGHIHDYERTYPLNPSLSEENYQTSLENGTTYLTSGGWGAPLGGWGSKEWIAYGPETRYHFTLVDIHENNMLSLKTIDLDNKVFDTLTIQKTPFPQPEEEPSITPLMIVGIIAAACATVVIIYTYFTRK